MKEEEEEGEEERRRGGEEEEEEEENGGKLKAVCMYVASQRKDDYLTYHRLGIPYHIGTFMAYGRYFFDLQPTLKQKKTGTGKSPSFVYTQKQLKPPGKKKDEETKNGHR
jgi:hypothetical protein